MNGLLVATVAIAISATVIGWILDRIRIGCFDPREDLPLGLCNFTALIAPAQAYTQAPLLTAWAICLGGPAGLISLVTPDLEEHHDKVTRVKFWIVHAGLVVHAILCAVLLAPRGGVWLIGGMLIMITGTMLADMALNLLLGANYMFLRRKPATRSLLDWFGPWPLYLAPMFLTVVAIMVATFFCWSLLWP